MQNHASSYVVLLSLIDAHATWMPDWSRVRMQSSLPPWLCGWGLDAMAKAYLGGMTWVLLLALSRTDIEYRVKGFKRNHFELGEFYDFTSNLTPFQPLLLCSHHVFYSISSRYVKGCQVRKHKKPFNPRWAYWWSSEVHICKAILTVDLVGSWNAANSGVGFVSLVKHWSYRICNSRRNFEVEDSNLHLVD